MVMVMVEVMAKVSLPCFPWTRFWWERVLRGILLYPKVAPFTRITTYLHKVAAVAGLGKSCNLWPWNLNLAVWYRGGRNGGRDGDDRQILPLLWCVQIPQLALTRDVVVFSATERDHALCFLVFSPGTKKCSNQVLSIHLSASNYRLIEVVCTYIGRTIYTGMYDR